MTKPETLIRLFEDPADPGTCRGCHAPIVWRETLRGARMPCEPGAVPRKSARHAETHRVIGYYAADETHWAVCPERQQFSTRGRHGV